MAVQIVVTSVEHSLFGRSYRVQVSRPGNLVIINVIAWLIKSGPPIAQRYVLPNSHPFLITTGPSISPPPSRFSHRFTAPINNRVTITIQQSQSFRRPIDEV